MDIPSFKKTVIMGFYEAILQETLKGNSLILATHSGIITGTPIPAEEIEAIESKSNFSEMTKKESSICMTSTMLEAMGEAYDEKYDAKHSSPENDGCILLKDVVLRSSGATYSFQTFVVFFDQILGVSYGNVSIDEN